MITVGDAKVSRWMDACTLITWIFHLSRENDSDSISNFAIAIVNVMK